MPVTDFGSNAIDVLCHSEHSEEPIYTIIIDDSEARSEAGPAVSFQQVLHHPASGAYHGKRVEGRRWYELAAVLPQLAEKYADTAHQRYGPLRPIAHEQYDQADPLERGRKAPARSLL